MTPPENPARKDRWLRAVVALAAITLSVAGSVAGHQGVPAGYLLASALKIAAGALAGSLYGRSEVGKRMVA